MWSRSAFEAGMRRECRTMYSAPSLDNSSAVACSASIPTSMLRTDIGGGMRTPRDIDSTGMAAVWICDRDFACITRWSAARSATAHASTEHSTSARTGGANVIHCVKNISATVVHWPAAMTGTTGKRVRRRLIGVRVTPIAATAMRASSQVTSIWNATAVVAIAAPAADPSRTDAPRVAV